ncbi:unnamed protein product [Didymodactylos carnosus]|uniref:Uncharacterized protein n=1 Tax=Didymodactylos carnosus TaxID=1234261 RepID=A0A813W1S9_9BILA|nr:unnamed protein product [Didymodactylos carnosus]CAF1043825.1 unnamed protein product [Didymodactylos carnosus]CAF3638841.1 unnamed protein product [Didymodactylos carnosus]CAF3811959.1 unnamed protein product [Didymodactylos carnosus]
MQSVKSYFSTWKPFWKKTSSSENHQNNYRTLTLSPSTVNFTNSSLGDLKHSIIDEKLMIDISTKLMESDCPPKLQVVENNHQWFALNNSHLLVYRQLERIGLCDKVVCDIIPSQNIPEGIRETLTNHNNSSNPFIKRLLHTTSSSTTTPITSHNYHQINERNTVHGQCEQYVLMDDLDGEQQDEILYYADIPTDSCAYLQDEQCDCDGTYDSDSETRSEQTDENYGEWQRSSAISTTSNNNNELEQSDDDDKEKEMQSLL